MVAVALSNSLLSIVNNRSLVPQCLSASCGALALAANSHSLAVGCCLSGVADLQPTTAHWCFNVSLPRVVLLLAATGKALAANSRSLVVGCCCCCASLACSHRLAFSSFPIINNRSLVRASLSLCLVWCSCSCSHQPLIGCRLLLLLCFSGLQPQAKRLQPTAAHWL